MSKAILVIDMPSCCNVCIFNNAIGECRFVGNVDVALQHGLRYVECPLKPMPKKKEFSNYDDYPSTFDMGCAEGYNDCIDEIIGENDNE